MIDKVSAYQKFIRRTGVIDLGLFTVLALPFIATYFLELLFSLGRLLGDSRPLPDINDPFVMLAVNLVGIFGLFSAWLRIKGPAEDFGRVIGTVKLVAAGLFGFSVFMGAPLILLAFCVVDFVTGSRMIFQGNKLQFS